MRAVGPVVLVADVPEPSSAFLPAGWGGLEVMTVTALCLLAVAPFLLPASERTKLRWPAFCLALVGLFLGVQRSFDEATLAGGGSRLLTVLALLCSLVALGRLCILVFVDGVLTHRLSRPVPKIFRDILQGIIYALVVLIVLRGAGAQFDALLTTSALLTAVIGLSLQDTLGNLFAGLSIQAQHPFEVGDWIQYGEEKASIGRVIEINWRATRVLTLDQVEIIIPNGPLARASIYNFSKPSRLSRRSLHIVVAFEVPPHRVRAIVLDAIAGTPGVLEHPAVSVLTADFTERGVRYWVRFHIDDFPSREAIDGAVRERIWYALRRNDIEFARPLLEVGVQQADAAAVRRDETGLQRRRDTLLRADLARALSAEQLDVLARASKERVYAAGEVIVKAGEAGHELFIVQQGAVAVFVGVPPCEVARLTEGALFGEMSVMTGEARSATVRALVPTQLLAVGRDAFKHLLEEAPALAERLSELLAERRQALEEHSREHGTECLGAPGALQHRRELLERIRGFFSIGA